MPTTLQLERNRKAAYSTVFRTLLLQKETEKHKERKLKKVMVRKKILNYFNLKHCLFLLFDELLVLYQTTGKLSLF
jgi:hypothetical protein